MLPFADKIRHVENEGHMHKIEIEMMDIFLDNLQSFFCKQDKLEAIIIISFRIQSFNLENSNIDYNFWDLFASKFRNSFKLFAKSFTFLVIFKFAARCDRIFHVAIHPCFIFRVWPCFWFAPFNVTFNDEILRMHFSFAFI